MKIYALPIALAMALVPAGAWANDAETRPSPYVARLHHAKNEEIMKQCNRMTDTPGVDWAAVAALRHITVTMDDCVRASAGLAAEFRQ
jgi:hypothetical protein